MTGFFARMSISKRLLCLGIMALVMVAIPTSFYIILSWSSLESAQKRVAGLAPAAQVLEIVRLTQQHRGLSAVWLSGNNAAAQKRAQKQIEVDSAFSDMNAIVSQQLTNQELIVHWQSTVNQWEQLRSALNQNRLDKKQSFADHNMLVEELLATGDLLNDEFSLSHDSDANFSNLSHAVLYLIPEISDSMGKARAIGASALSTGSVSINDRIALTSLITTVKRLNRKLNREFDLLSASSPAMMAPLQDSLQALRAGSDAAVELTEKEILTATALSYPSANYFQQLTKAIDAQAAMSQQGLQGLGSILDERIDERMDKLMKLAIQLLFVTALAIWIGFSISKSITRQLGGDPDKVVEIAQAVAKGELTTVIDTSQAHRNSVTAAMSDMQNALSHLVINVRDSSESIATGTVQISTANQDLSQRTEQHASSLVETAAAVTEIATTVKQTTETVGRARALAESANTAAIEGGMVVNEVHETMQAIEESAKKIQAIIAVVDEIAFQTNILALNAAVEAARAGDQGRGFAVVASEVRSLALRSADSAQQVRSLILESVETVGKGSTLVNRAGISTNAIVEQIKTVTELMNDIANASTEQAQGIDQIGTAMASIDKTTQQNAAMVEESAASAETLRQEADKLISLVAVFKVQQSLNAGATS